MQSSGYQPPPCLAAGGGGSVGAEELDPGALLAPPAVALPAGALLVLPQATSSEAMTERARTLGTMKGLRRFFMRTAHHIRGPSRSANRMVGSGKALSIPGHAAGQTSIPGGTPKKWRATDRGSSSDTGSASCWAPGNTPRRTGCPSRRPSPCSSRSCPIRGPHRQRRRHCSRSRRTTARPRS
jgi:hypothetical protein